MKLNTLMVAVALTSSGVIAGSAKDIRVSECKLSYKMLSQSSFENKAASEHMPVGEMSAPDGGGQTMLPAAIPVPAADPVILSTTAEVSKGNLDTQNITETKQNQLNDIYQAPMVEQAQKLSIQEVGLKPELVAKSHNYFELKPKPARSDRIYVDPKTGVINFRVDKGELKENIIALLKETREAKEENLIWAVAPHKEAATYWISGGSMLEVAQNLVGHHKMPEQIKLGLYTNGMIAVYYESNKEFAQ